MTGQQTGKIIFTFLLLLAALLLLFLTLPLGRMAQLVPIRVVVPTAGLLLFQLSIELYGRNGKRSRAARQSKKAASVSSIDSSAVPRRPIKEYLVLGMIAFLPALIYLLGFILSATLFIWLYYQFYFRKSFMVSACLSLGAAVFLYFLLVLLLGMDIRSGIIWSLSASAF